MDKPTVKISNNFCIDCGCLLEAFARMKDGKVAYPVFGCPNCLNREYLGTNSNTKIELEGF